MLWIINKTIFHIDRTLWFLWICFYLSVKSMWQRKETEFLPCCYILSCFISHLFFYFWHQLQQPGLRYETICWLLFTKQQLHTQILQLSISSAHGSHVCLSPKQETINYILQTQGGCVFPRPTASPLAVKHSSSATLQQNVKHVEVKHKSKTSQHVFISKTNSLESCESTWASVQTLSICISWGAGNSEACRNAALQARSLGFLEGGEKWQSQEILY